MNDKNSRRTRFQAHIRKRNSLVTSLSLLLVGSSLIFNLLIVFAPQLFNTPFSSSTPIPIGIFIGLALIVTFFILCIIYVVIAANTLDADLKRTLEAEE